MDPMEKLLRDGIQVKGENTPFTRLEVYKAAEAAIGRSPESQIDVLRKALAKAIEEIEASPDGKSGNQDAPHIDDPQLNAPSPINTHQTTPGPYVDNDAFVEVPERTNTVTASKKNPRLIISIGLLIVLLMIVIGAGLLAL